MIDERQLATTLRKLPAFPAAAAKLLEVVRKPQSTAADIESAVKHDAALTANILRLANSAFFGLSRQVGSVSHAVTLLGRSRVTDLAVTATYSKLLPEFLPGYGLTAAGFFAHSAAVGALAAALAKRAGLAREADEAFLAGLLHDLGKLAIGTFLEGVSAAVLSAVKDKNLAYATAEREVLGTDHAEVGGALAERWLLPSYVVDAAVLHHDPERAQGSDSRRLVDAVHIANALAHSLGWGADQGELYRRADRGAMQRLGLKGRDLEQVAATTMDRVTALIKSRQESS